MSNGLMLKTKEAKMKETFDFLKRLSANNDRGWFNANRAEFDMLRERWLAHLGRVIGFMAKGDESLRYLEPKDAAYRIYRDTRFSNDKTPYKTFFSACISPRGRKNTGADWYLHFAPGDSCIFGGIWNPEPWQLKKIRKAIVDNIEEFHQITENAELVEDFPDWWGRRLKTAPKGYDRNHPDIDLLRLIEYGKAHYLADDFFSRKGWEEEMACKALKLKPLIDFINYSLTEDN